MEFIDQLIAQMTLEEKSSLCSGLNFWYLKGIERLDIPFIMVTDGPHGLRKQASAAEKVELNESIPATCFPTASALAATWNRDLVFQVGEALGEECRTEKVGVLLGPGANIKRSPLCGRNFEYFSEDPFLTGEMAKSHINGVQSKGIGTSLKHYAVNNQEFRRMMIDAIVDERALREIYLSGYEIAIKGAQPWTVMCAYNHVNGTYCSENKYLMTDILKKEWGHEGLVVTDWGAMNERVKGLQAGIELEMPGTANGNDAKIVAAVQSGELDESVLDQSVKRILEMIFKAHKTLSEDYSYDAQVHHALAREVVGESIVLLKNENSILPIKKSAKIALIGQFAKKPRYQGAGSSLINPTKMDTLYEEMIQIIGKENVSYVPGYSEKGEYPNEVLIQEAISIANAADVVVISAGLTDLYETEGLDRQHMKLPPEHDALIKRLAASHSNVIVVLSNGSPVEMPWIGDVNAVLEGHLGGQAGAGGMADILFGEVNPSGKLAETFPIRLEDNPSYHCFPGGPQTVEYRESIYVGYRYYDTVEQDVLFPFGYGLSYTVFEYSDLKLSQDEIKDDDTLMVSLKVKNIGKQTGKEIVQVYVRDIESTIFRPTKELKGFSKINLQPGEEKEITVELNKRAFAYYNVEVQDWCVESGMFEIQVGASSKDIRLKADVEINSSQDTVSVIDPGKLAAYDNFPRGAAISQKDFETLLGSTIPQNRHAKKGEYTINTPIGDMQDSFIGRQLYNMMKRNMEKMIQGQEDTATGIFMVAMMKELPMRSILMFGEGPFTREMLDAVLVMINGQFLKGLLALLKADRKKA
ncbi:MAG: glycoside hydrolase family 3 C-terminal domain-containing protein [Anaerolineaceae bacterium]|nr:glycoside hydrolase family 3 C-terminal domain-containing protein [Anaerolineaceae bacterium]